MEKTADLSKNIIVFIHRFKRPAFIIIMFFILMLMLEGCRVVVVDRPHHVPSHSVVYIYDYYPAVRVYYDVERRVYYYLERDRWVSTYNLPPGIQKRLGSSVRMKSDNDRPYLKHKDHFKKYPPSRYRENNKKVIRNNDKIKDRSQNNKDDRDDSNKRGNSLDRAEEVVRGREKKEEVVKGREKKEETKDFKSDKDKKDKKDESQDTENDELDDSKSKDDKPKDNKDKKDKKGNNREDASE